MSWVTIIWSMVASACLTMAAMHLLIWCKKRTAWASLLFSLTAVATAAMAFYELRMMGAETPGQFGTALRWVHVPAFALIVGLVGFVQIHLRAGRRWLAWTTCAVRAFSLLLNFLMEPNVNYREVTRLRHIPFLGDSVSVCEGVPSPWNLVGHLSLLLLVIFVSDAGITVWRRGDRRQAVVVGGSIVFFVLGATVQTMLARWEVFHWPQTSSLFFLVIVAAMAYELSRDVLSAAQLSDDLREREQRLDLAADSAGVGMWSWDFKSNLIWATERARMLYGFSSDELIPFEKLLSKLHSDDLDWVVQASQKCLQEGVDFRHEYRIVLPDGSIRWFKVLAKAFLEPSGKPGRMTGVSLDITERKQTELELQQRRHELAHLSRVNMLGELAGSLAHELNQPLGAILRNAEAGELFLQEPSPDLDEVRAILADIRKDDQRAGAVIDRMRAWMKRREVERCLLNINLLAAEVVTLVRPDAEMRRVQVAVETDPAVQPVHGDRVQLQQVLLNLLLNAMDALDDNPPARRLVTVRARSAGSTVEVTVSDTGHGISEDKLLRVFEPFFTSKPNGLGMGLSISHSIIKAHGGRLWAENNAAGGATFTFTLPVAKGGDAK